MIPSIEPDQARAFKAWIIDCLNTDDNGDAVSPALFSDANVAWSHVDLPRSGNLYALLREVSLVDNGEPDDTSVSTNVGTPSEVLTVRSHQIADWTVSVQLVSKQSDSAPSYELAAGRFLRRVTMRVDDENSMPMREVGCAWRRSGQILPLPQIARGSQWETRAAVDLTFAVGEVIVTRPGWIESMSGTGTLSPLEPEILTVTADDDPDAF